MEPDPRVLAPEAPEKVAEDAPEEATLLPPKGKITRPYHRTKAVDRD
jgi:hypothetical protein